jgi:hypothetical protein
VIAVGERAADGCRPLTHAQHAEAARDGVAGSRPVVAYHQGECIAVPAMILVNDDVSRMLQRWTPFGGFAIQHTRDRHDYFVSPWRGFAIAAAYAVVALVTGVLVTNRRDV